MKRSSIELEVSKIAVTGLNPRKAFDEDQMKELIESIRISGILQPLLVRPKGDEYDLVIGERRLRAAKEIGLKMVPAIVRDMTDEQVLLAMLTENLQREDLNPIEEAEAIERLVAMTGRTHEEVGRAFGKTKSWIDKRLQLLSMPDDIRQLLEEERISAKNIEQVAPHIMGPKADEIRCFIRDELQVSGSTLSTRALDDFLNRLFKPLVSPAILSPEPAIESKQPLIKVPPLQTRQSVLTVDIVEPNVDACDGCPAWDLKHQGCLEGHGNATNCPQHNGGTEPVRKIGAEVPTGITWHSQVPTDIEETSGDIAEETPAAKLQKCHVLECTNEAEAGSHWCKDHRMPESRKEVKEPMGAEEKGDPTERRVITRGQYALVRRASFLGPNDEKEPRFEDLERAGRPAKEIIHRYKTMPRSNTAKRELLKWCYPPLAEVDL